MEEARDSPRQVEHALHAAAFETRAMIRRWISLVPSRSIDPQLAQEALRDVRAHVAAPAEDLHAAVRAARAASLTNSFAIDALACTTLGSAAASTRRATSSVSSRPCGVGGRVGQRERHALVVHDPAAALLAFERPGRCSSIKRHIEPTPRAAMPCSSANQARCRSSPPPRPPITESAGTSTPLKRMVG